jgi:hypothetical protein
MVRGPRGSFKAPGTGQAGHENKSALAAPQANPGRNNTVRGTVGLP